MSSTQIIDDDEIDLFEIFETLWNGKWKIVTATVITTVIGVILGVFFPGTYTGSTLLSKAEDSAFTKYTFINTTLKNSGFDYSINSELAFNLFLSEFEDYEEILEILKENNYTKNLLQKTDANNRDYVMAQLAKDFKIIPPSKKNEEWTLEYEWHDADEGRLILKSALEKILTNVHKTIVADIDELASAISIRNSQKEQNLNADLLTIGESLDIDRTKRLLYLKEQSAIAKKLGIEKNSLNGNELLESQSNSVALSVNSSEVPFYLRGYKAIDKEIDIITSRSKEENRAINEAYTSTRKKLISIRNDVSNKQVLSAKNYVADHGFNNWVVYDLSLVSVKSQNKPLLYLALSILLGGMVGIFYVLISNAFRKRQIVGKQ